MAACGSSNFQVGADRLHVSWLHVSSVELLAEDGIAHMVGGTTSQQLGHVHQVPQFSTCSRIYQVVFEHATSWCTSSH